jgi:glycosyltransferase involved in cell wall biosynthesis
MNKVPISVLMPVLNEAHQIGRALSSVSWADEIYVVDSHSKDETPLIAEQHGAHVVQFDYKPPWPKKRNWALATLPFRNEWILILDADEVMPPEAEEEIRAAIHNTKHSGYWINRRFFFIGRWLKHAYFPNWNLRLLKHAVSRYERLTENESHSGDNEAHEHIIIQGTTGKLNCIMDHYAFPTIDSFVERHNKYSNWEAHAAIEKPAENSTATLNANVAIKRLIKRLTRKLPFRPTLRFLYIYIIQRGFLDGREGYYFARLHGFYEFLNVAKTYELKKNRKHTAFQDSLK